MNKYLLKKIFQDEVGAVAVYVGLMLFFLVTIAAFAIDLNHAYGVRNELQNAADAGALAGALVLNDDSGVLQVAEARDEAARIATQHTAGGRNVEDSDLVIQTGHWSNSLREFRPSASTTQLEDWVDLPGDVLDTEWRFINAVRVEATRADSPTFFAKIFGSDSLAVTNDAVAWVGFNELTVDYPYAICKDAVGWDDNNDGVPDPECNVGSLSNDRSDVTDPTAETAMWTNLNQEGLCPSLSSNANEMKELTEACGEGGAWELDQGEPIGTTNGEVVPAFDNMFDCWENMADSDGDGEPDSPWQLVLPVVDCNESNTCPKLLGALQVSIVWMTDQNDPHMNNVPQEMNHPDGSLWSCDPSSVGSEACWADFIDKFDLKDISGDSAEYMTRSVYFMTTCFEAEPEGNSTLNPASKILAKYPKLVE